jgi:uncharacterized protein (DUF4415 family)
MSASKQTRALLTEDDRVLIEQPDGSFRLAEGQTDWRRLRAMADAEALANAASDPDAPPLDDDFFSAATRLPAPALTQTATRVPIDGDVLSWFRSHGRGWRARLNAVLRAHIEAHKRE